ncbi:MAG: hypothetical protein ACE5EX_00290 [Phycisphaerae bacterium]
MSDYDLEVLDATNGTVLYSETGRTNPIVGTLDHFPLRGGWEVDVEGPKTIVVPESELRIAGGPTLTAAALEIRMIAHPPTLPQGISSMDIKAADIPSLTIIDEDFEVLGGPSIPAVSTWGLIVMSLLILTVGTVVARGHCANQASPSSAAT